MFMAHCFIAYNAKHCIFFQYVFVSTDINRGRSPHVMHYLFVLSHTKRNPSDNEEHICNRRNTFVLTPDVKHAVLELFFGAFFTCCIPLHNTHDLTQP